MNKILGSLLFTFTFLWARSITATVDTQEVLEGDSVLLTLLVVGKNIDTIPDIEEVNGYKVINLQRRSKTNFVHVNGKSSMERTQILMLEFKPDANMTIPSFSAKVDGEIKKTDPIKVTVLKSLSGAKRETKDFSLDVQLSKSKFYLGESVVLKVLFKQRTNIDIMQIEYTPPKFQDFFSKQIGNGKTYKKGAFTIQELDYLLIAKKSGKLTLEPARAKVAQRSRQRQMGGWFVDVPKWTQLSSPSLIVEVTKPTEAHDIVGQYSLKDSVDHRKVKANKPVTLQVELVGKGTLDDYDGVSFEIPSVTIYSDDAKIESKLLGNELQSRYSKSFVFISDHNFTIPSKEIRLYDYKRGEVKVLKTKEYKIEVEGGEKAMASTFVHAQKPAQVTKALSSNSEPWYNKLPSLIALLIAFVLGVVTTLSFNYLPRFVLPKLRSRSSSFKNEEALRLLYPKMGESQEVEEMVRKLYAFKNGDKSIKIDKQRLKELVEQYK